MSAFAAEIKEAVRSVLEEYKLPTHRDQRLLKIPQAAAYLALSVRSVEEMIARGEIPSVKHGRARMLDLKDLDRWIEEHKDAATR